MKGAEIRSVCTEAGMFAIRARRKIATEKDFLEAVNKVIKSYAKFSATPRYMTYNWALKAFMETLLIGILSFYRLVNNHFTQKINGVKIVCFSDIFPL